MTFGPFINILNKDRQEKLNRKELNYRVNAMHLLVLALDNENNDSIQPDPSWVELTFHMAKLKLVVDQHFHE